MNSVCFADPRGVAAHATALDAEQCLHFFRLCVFDGRLAAILYGMCTKHIDQKTEHAMHRGRVRA